MVFNGNFVRQFLYMTNRLNYFLSFSSQAHSKDTKTYCYFIFPSNVIQKNHQKITKITIFKIFNRKKLCNAF